MGTEKADSPESGRERKASTVSYNHYDTVTSITSNGSGASLVYDTISSTTVGSTIGAGRVSPLVLPLL